MVLAGLGGGFAGGLAGGAMVTIVIRAVDNFSRPMKNAEKSVVRLDKATKGLKIAGAAVAIGFAAAIKTTIEFESAFAGVRKTVDLTEAGFADLEKRFKTLSTEIPISFVELSKIGELAGQLGVEGVDNLAKFTRTIADISKTTNLTSEAAATDFARIANIMQEPIENIDRMGSTIVELGNNLATTEQEISNFALRIAAAGKISGMSTSEVMAIGAAFSSVGVQAERGGTAVNKVLIQMTESITEGGEKLEVFARTAGLTTMEFKEMFEEDAAGAFEKFVKGLGTMGDEAFKILEDLGLADQRLIQSFLALAGAGDTITNAFTLAEQGWVENTALVVEAEKRYGTMESQIELLIGKLKLLGDEVGKELAPILLDIVTPLGDLAIVFGELSDPTKNLFTQFGLLIIAAAGIALVSGPAALAVLGIGAAIISINAILEKFGTNIPGIFAGVIASVATGILFVINIFAEKIIGLINRVVDAMNLIIDAWNFIRKLVGKDPIEFKIKPVKFIPAKYPEIDFGPKPFTSLLPFTGEVGGRPAKTPGILTGIGMRDQPFQGPRPPMRTEEDLLPKLSADDFIEKLASGGFGEQTIYNITIENIFGVDAEEISRALKEELSFKISI